MTKSLEALEWFLPLQLPPEHHSIGYELWFDEFMTLWEVCYNAPEWENEMMCLIAELAFHNIGYIDWEPYIPLMFTRFVRYLKLPVTYSQTQSSKDHKINMSFIAIWTTSVLVGLRALISANIYRAQTEFYTLPNIFRETVRARRCILRNF